VCVVACAGALFSFAQIGIGFTPTLPLLSAFRAIAMLAQPMGQPVGPAIVSLVAPPARMGAWMAAVSTSSSLIRALAPLMLGILFDQDPSVPFIVTGSAASLTFLCAALLIQRVPRPHAGSATAPTAELPSSEPHEQAADPLGGKLGSSAQDHVIDLEAEYERLLHLKHQLDSGEVDDFDAAADPTDEDVEELGRFARVLHFLWPQ
ncbi:MAG: hypothetical protein SGPRY_003194, partial [Prymnesium sp.]